MSYSIPSGARLSNSIAVVGGNGSVEYLPDGKVIIGESGINSYT